MRPTQVMGSPPRHSLVPCAQSGTRTFAAGQAWEGADVTDLNRQQRERDRDALASGRTIDVLVVGGGVTGAGVALDAASRGLDVALVEAHDLAYGTSRWSSKLVHGGLRYLAHGDIAVAWESAVERRHLMGTIAPHLIRALPQVLPHFTDTKAQDRLLVRAGLSAADALRTAARTPRGLLGRARSLSPDEVITLIPGVDRDRLTGGSVYWDGQLVDDARLVTAIARTAAHHGARVLTRTRATEITATGARVRDTLDGSSYDVHARAVIVAAGVWTPQLDPDTHLIASRGSHVLLAPASLGHPRAAITVAVPGDISRYVFALPTVDGPVIVGITDVPVDGPLIDVPLAPHEDVQWILGHLSAALARPLNSSDVIGTYAGLRPLVAPTSSSAAGDPSADISRRHLVARHDNGAIVVTGGKLTTYRRMAQDAVDLAALPQAGPCRTTDIALVGAQPYRTPAPPGVPLRLVRHYGAEAPRVAAHARNDPSLLDPVAPGVGVLGVEIVHAIVAEGALSLEDITERRTRLSLVPASLDAARDKVIDVAQSVDPRVDIP